MPEIQRLATAVYPALQRYSHFGTLPPGTLHAFTAVLGVSLVRPVLSLEQSVAFAGIVPVQLYEGDPIVNEVVLQLLLSSDSLI